MCSSRPDSGVAPGKQVEQGSTGRARNRYGQVLLSAQYLHQVGVLIPQAAAQCIHGLHELGIARHYRLSGRRHAFWRQRLCK